MRLADKIAIRKRIRTDVCGFFKRVVEIDERALQVLEHSSTHATAPSARQVLSAAVTLYPALSGRLTDAGVDLLDGYLPDLVTVESASADWYRTMQSCFLVGPLARAGLRARDSASERNIPDLLAGSAYRVMASGALRVEDLLLGPIEAESVTETVTDVSRLTLWYMARQNVDRLGDGELVSRFLSLPIPEDDVHGLLDVQAEKRLRRACLAWRQDQPLSNAIRESLKQALHRGRELRNSVYSRDRVKFYGRLRKKLNGNIAIDPSAGSQQFLLEWDARGCRFRPFGTWGAYQLQESPLLDGSLWIARGNVIQPSPVFGDEAISELECLIAKDAQERHFQDFFESHPEFLLALGDYTRIHPHLVLCEDDGGRLIPDFFLEKMDSSFCDICDLKQTTPEIVRRQHHRVRFRDAVREALAQLEHYRDWFEERGNRAAFYSRYGLHGFRPRVIAIIGRRTHFRDEIERIRLEGNLPSFAVLRTYDDVVDKARQWRAFAALGFDRTRRE